MAKYSAIYYPDCYVGSGRALATYMLLYDELHLVALSDDAKNPTVRFRELPKYTIVTAINKGKTVEFAVTGNEIRTSGDLGELDDQIRRTLFFYQFVQRYKVLIGDALFFHPHLLSSAMTRFTDKLLGMRCPRFLWTRNWDNEIPRSDKEDGRCRRESEPWETSWD